VTERPVTFVIAAGSGGINVGIRRSEGDAGMSDIRNLGVGKSGTGSRFRIRARGLPEDMGYILQSSENDFMYAAVDADVRIEIDGKPPFAPGSHRLSDDGFLRSIPILDFAWKPVVACTHLGKSDPSIERVTVTSTDYVLEFERHTDSAQVRVRERKQGGKILAETSITLAELQRECKAVAELSLVAVFSENPALRGNPHLKRLASEIEMLSRQIKQ
jgi:hypothetical protein